MKRVCIHQPDFAPYLGFFHRLLLVDIFVMHDDVQFLKGGWHHRDKIKTACGEAWLTVPVKRGGFQRKIYEVELSKDDFSRYKRNLDLLRANYGAAPFFKQYFPKINELYLSGHSKLVDLNMDLLIYFFSVFEISVPYIKASELRLDGNGNNKIINILKSLGGTHYLSGTGARAYLDEKLFEKSGLVVEWQDFFSPVYPQLFGDFIPNLSCLDVVFNCGPKSSEILRSCLKEKSV